MRSISAAAFATLLSLGSVSAFVPAGQPASIGRPSALHMALDYNDPAVAEEFAQVQTMEYDDVADEIAQRRATREALSRRIPPFVFEGALPPVDEWELRADAVSDQPLLAAGDSISGLPAVTGMAEGRACIVTDPFDPGDLGPGDVLIAPLTDPAWTPLFIAAEAVVVDVGGQMSHAVIVAREFGMPCVVAATDATSRIPHGAMVRVDGSTGTVTLLE